MGGHHSRDDCTACPPNAPCAAAFTHTNITKNAIKSVLERAAEILNGCESFCKKQELLYKLAKEHRKHMNTSGTNGFRFIQDPFGNQYFDFDTIVSYYAVSLHSQTLPGGLLNITGGGLYKSDCFEFDKCLTKLDCLDTCECTALSDAMENNKIARCVGIYPVTKQVTYNWATRPWVHFCDDNRREFDQEDCELVVEVKRFDVGGDSGEKIVVLLGDRQCEDREDVVDIIDCDNASERQIVDSSGCVTGYRVCLKICRQDCGPRPYLLRVRLENNCSCNLAEDKIRLNHLRGCEKKVCGSCRPYTYDRECGDETTTRFYLLDQSIKPTITEKEIGGTERLMHRHDHRGY